MGTTSAFLERMTSFILKHPKWTLAILAIGTLLFSFRIVTNIRVDNSLENLVDEDNEVVATFLEDLDQFGGNALLLAAFETDELLSDETLSMIDDLTKRMEANQRLRSVISITNVLVLEGDEEGLNIDPLIESLPLSADQKNRVLEKIKTDETLLGNLVSEDLSATAIVAQFEYNVRNDIYFNEVTREVRELAQEYAGTSFHFSGVSVVVSEINNRSLNDIVLLTVGTTLMMTLALLFVFRGLTGIVLSHLVIAVSVGWTVGLMTLFNVPITMATTMLPTLIIIIGISDVIHLIFQYYEEAAHIREKRQALISAIGKVGPPCLMTSLTTAVGFVSLVVSQIIPVRQFGYIAAMGLVLTYFVAFTLVPCALLFLPLPAASIKKKLDQKLTGRALLLLGRFNTRFRWLVLVSGALVILFSVLGILRIRAENSTFDFFKQSDPLLASIRFADQKFTGGNHLDVLFMGQGPDALVEPEALQGMDRMQDFLETFPEIRKVMSLNDLVKRINRSMNEERREFEKIPESRQLVAQYLLLFSMSGGKDLETIVAEDYSKARTTARLVEIGSARQQQIVDAVNDFAKKNPNPHYHVVVSGGVTLNASLVGYLIESQVKSFGLALAMIFLMFILLFRSLRVALVTLIPNIIPISMTLGLMGWFDVPLNIVTVMIASIAIGIAVDDTIHYSVRAHLEFVKDRDYDASMSRVLGSAGRAIVFTSLVITPGFAATLLSSFKPPIQFGFLAGTTMLTALFGDLVVLPVLLWLFKPFGRSGGSKELP